MDVFDQTDHCAAVVVVVVGFGVVVVVVVVVVVEEIACGVDDQLAQPPLG